MTTIYKYIVTNVMYTQDDPCLYPSTIGNIYEDDESSEDYENHEDNEDSDDFDDYEGDEGIEVEDEGDYEMNEEDEGNYGTEDLGNENTTPFEGRTQRMENGNQEVKNNHALEVGSPQSKSMDFSSWIDWSLADL